MTPPPEDSSLDRGKQIAVLLDNYPGYWIVFGLSLFLITAGSVSVVWGDTGVQLSKPINQVVSAFLMILGFSSMLLGAFVIIKKNKWGSLPIYYIFIVLWLAGFTAVVFDYIQKQEKHTTYYFQVFGYSWEDGTFHVNIPRRALAPFKGEKMVFAIRNKRVSPGYEPEHMDFTKPATIPIMIENNENFDAVIPCPKVAEVTNLGDTVQLALIIVPKDAEIPEPMSLDGIIAGDESRIVDKISYDAAMQRVSVATLAKAAKTLDTGAANQLIAKLSEETK